MAGKKIICTVSLSLILGLALTSSTKAELIGWWKFDDNFLNSSGNGHHGEPVGDPTFVDGQFGQAIRLNENSTDQYINCGPELGFTTVGDGGVADGFSIAAWLIVLWPAGTIKYAVIFLLQHGPQAKVFSSPYITTEPN